MQLTNTPLLTLLALATTALSNPTPQLFDAYCTHKRTSKPPKDTFFRAQLTDKISCNDADSCSAYKFDERTFGYSVSAGANTPFASLGLGVTEEWSSGEEYQCGVEEGETVCVWVKVRYLEYEVEHENCDYEHGTSMLRAPKTGMGAGDYYCVTGTASCRTKGEGYWSDEP